MDSGEAQKLWRELLALRTRVEWLEARLMKEEAAPIAPEEGSPKISFTPPQRPSLESRIGSQLFNRVGIVALLIGAAWFLKYAVDQRWLGDAGRVLVGFASGLGLIGWSERFRRRGYPVFSFSLKAAGTGILYLALWASFSLFHLVSYPAAFAGMVLVTAANVWMCAVQRSEALAAVAMVGGFLTPALLGQQTSVWTLGSYLVLLNAGLLLLLWRRVWPRLLPGALAGTEAYLLVMAVRAPELLRRGETAAAFFLAALFFAVFSVVPALLPGSRAGLVRRAAAGVTLAGAVLGTAEMWRLFPAGLGAERALPFGGAAWFAGLLAARRLRGAGLAPVHAALVIAFAALGIWSAGAGGGVAAGWALEAVVLLLLALRGGGSGAESVLRSPVPSALLLLAGSAWLVGSSLFGPLQTQPRVLWNARCGLFFLLAGAAVLGVRVAARRVGDAEQESAPLLRQWRVMGAGASLLATVLVLLAGVFEIHDYWRSAAGTAERFWDSAWAALLGVGLLVLGFGVRWAWLRWQGLGLVCLAVGKVVVFDTRALSQGFRIVSFLGLGVVLLLVSFIYQRDLLNLRGREHGG